MPRYWIVSPNIEMRHKHWIPVILSNQTAYMGHSTQNPTGAVFAGIKRGDLVLIAYGSLQNHGNNRCLVACGRVQSNHPRSDPRAPGANQFARLRPFLPLDEDPTAYGISFKGTKHDGNRRPPAVFELVRDDPDYPGNAKLCAWLDRTLSNTEETTLEDNSGGVIANTVSTDGETNTEGHEIRTKARMIKALHRENKLVTEYRRALKKKGNETIRLRYLAGTDTLYCDVYEPRRRNLIEAKGSTNREDIRMAIGQLFDYDRLTQAAGKRKSKRAILLPEKPNIDIERLLDSVEIALIWKRGKTFTDNRGGKFV